MVGCPAKGKEAEEMGAELFSQTGGANKHNSWDTSSAARVSTGPNHKDHTVLFPLYCHTMIVYFDFAHLPFSRFHTIPLFAGIVIPYSIPSVSCAKANVFTFVAPAVFAATSLRSSLSSPPPWIYLTPPCVHVDHPRGLV